MINKRIVKKEELGGLEFTEEEIIIVEKAAKKVRSFCEVSQILNRMVSRKIRENIAVDSNLIENRISYNPQALRNILKAGELMKKAS